MEVEVNGFIEERGGTKEMWPWKVLVDSQGVNDKWLVNKFKGNGWVKLKFKAPLMIRGYGLKSANNFPIRDPKDFSFLVMDVLDTDKKCNDPFKEVHKAKNQSFQHRW